MIRRARLLRRYERLERQEESLAKLEERTAPEPRSLCCTAQLSGPTLCCSEKALASHLLRRRDLRTSSRLDGRHVLGCMTSSLIGVRRSSRENCDSALTRERMPRAGFWSGRQTRS